MDKRALFLVPVVMALLGLALVWLGWVPGGSPGAPIHAPGAMAVDRGAERDGTPEGEPDERPTRRREHAGEVDPAPAPDVDPEPPMPDGEEDVPIGSPDLDTAAAESALALARATVERHRDDVHREKMYIVWPAPAESAPAAGAEILLITGYDRYEAVRVSWNGSGAVGARVVLRSRRDRGARLASHAFTVAPATFVRAWHAARLVVGARAKWKEPPPDTGSISGSMSVSSHAAYYWVRLRRGSGTALHESVTRSRMSSRGIRNWGEIQNRALFDMLAALIPETPVEAPLAAWSDPMTREIVAVTPLEELQKATRVLLRIALPVAGEAGGREALAAVRGLHASLTSEQTVESGADFWRADTAGACALAGAQIELRVDGSVEDALRIIRETPREHRWQEDLVQWTRGRVREADAALYLRALRADLAQRDNATLLAETVAELRRHFPDEVGATVGPALESLDPAVRVDAALSLLDAEARATEAIAALDAVASDTGLHPPTWQTFEKTPRARAVERLIEHGHWDVARMRAQFAAPGEDGRMLQQLDLALENAGAALSDLERREGYRTALDGRPDRGLITAMERLVELDDVPSFDRIDALLTRYAEPPESEDDLLDRWARVRLIPTLRNKLDEARQ